MKGDSRALPWVLVAIVVVTAARSIFLYLHQVTAARIVMRMTTDMQKAAFAHLINSDFARLTRETTGHLVSRLTNDLAFIQQAAQASHDRLRQGRPVGRRPPCRHALSRLDADPDRASPSIRWRRCRSGSVGRRLRSVARRTQSELGDMTSRLTEKLAGARLIKAFRLENYAIDRLNQQFRADLSSCA